MSRAIRSPAATCGRPSTDSLGSRAAVGVTGGTEDNWDSFSVQWDGVVQILEEGTQLATRSDEGSRLWLDIDHSGTFDDATELFSNGWGSGHGAQIGTRSPALAAGVYPLRIQFEEGTGGNTFSLVANPIMPVGSFSIYTDAGLTTPGLSGSYVNQNLAAVNQADWRLTQTIAGTRIDSQVNFTASSWGVRADVGLTGGTDADWNNFSVQWDGVVQIEQANTRLATTSDDSSRLWIDLNRDGVFDSTGAELVNNNWGQPQATTTSSGSVGLAPGVYPIRIQYEERSGGNVMQLVTAPQLTVRVAYVIPSNRTPQASAVANLQDYVPRLQQWYGEQLDRWGFGPLTFTYERQPDGYTPQVHVVHVADTDAYLRGDIWGRTISAAAAASVRTWTTGEIWLLFSEAHIQNADGSVSGGAALGASWGSGSDPGIAMLGGDALFRLSLASLLDNRSYAGQIVPEIGPLPLVQSTSFPWFEGSTFSSLASSIQGAGAHEIGHAWGRPHDFRNDANFRGDVMGNGLRGLRGASYPDRYPGDDMWLTYGDALALSVNRYFRPDLIPTENTAPTLTVSTSGTVAPVQGLLQVSFQAADASGLAAALLTRGGDLVAELPLSGTTASATLTTPYYRPGQSDSYTVTVYDRQGNRSNQAVTIQVSSGYNRAPEPFIRVSDSRPAVGQTVTLDASSTTDADHAASSLLVEWDLNGDGVFDTSPTTSKVYSTQFLTAGTRIVTARITDPSGAQAVAAPLALRIDSGPPTVVGTAPSLGDGTPTAGTAALDVVFSEPVLGGGAAARYQLQSAGPDGLPGTLDDALVPLTVAYAGSTATLRFPALTAGPYRLTVRDLLTDNAGNQLDGDGNGTGGGDWVRDFRVPELIVTSLMPTPSGFVARFSGEFQLDGLNLYDGAGGTLGAADVVLQNGAGQAVAGSLVVDSSRQAVTFVKTGGVLTPDTYTVTVKSGATAFRSLDGEPLDGNNDGTTGDNYTAHFAVASSAARVIRIPDVACGAGQGVNIPNTANGLPIGLDNADGVTSLAVDLVYDEELLDITAATLAGDLPADWTVANPPDISTLGVAKIRASGTTPLSGTNVDIVRLTAAMPGAAPYGAVQAIQLENAAVNGGAIAAVGDVAVHKAVYLGDADGSGIHSSADAFLTVQAALGLASGFAAHAWTDPRIVGDADGSGVLSAADAFLIVQEGLSLVEPFVPDNPHIGVTPVGGGVDPQFQIGVDLPASVGGLVTVPVMLNMEPAATNVGAIDFDLFFDASQLTIQLSEGVLAGADTAGWVVTAKLLESGHLRVGIASVTGQPLAPGLREIAQLRFHVAASFQDATPVSERPGYVVGLDIEPVDPRAGGYAWTDADGSVLIRPAKRAAVTAHGCQSRNDA